MTRHVPRQARAPISERPAEPLPVQCLAVPGGDAMRFSVGIDWASAAHAVCILDQTGRVHWQGAVPHTADGLADLLARLRRFRRRGSLRVALERPSGLLVDTLLDAGLEVVPIHPNALKASRPRYSAAGAKSDPGDAFILADLLRTDGHRFRPLHPPSDDTRALRALVRGRDDLVAQRIALANQLRALLERFWPGAAAIFADVDSPIALAFLARYPTPDSAARLGEQRLAQFLGQHAYCGRRPVAELLARLRRAPTSQVGAAEADASGDVVRALIAVLSPLVAHLQQLSAPLPPRWLSIPMARSCRACPAAALSTRRRSWPSSGMIARASPPTNSSRPRPAWRPSRMPPASTAPSCFAGRATSACAVPSRPSPIIPATPRGGRPSCISARVRVGVAISTRSGSSLARGPAFSGAAGRTAPHTTSADIAPRRRSPPPERAMVDTGCLMARAPCGAPSRRGAGARARSARPPSAPRRSPRWRAAPARAGSPRSAAAARAGAPRPRVVPSSAPRSPGRRGRGRAPAGARPATRRRRDPRRAPRAVSTSARGACGPDRG